MWIFHLASSIWLGSELSDLFTSHHFDSFQILSLGAILGTTLLSFVSYWTTFILEPGAYRSWLLLVIFAGSSFLIFIRKERKKIKFDINIFQFWCYLIFGFIWYTITFSTQFQSYRISREVKDLALDIQNINQLCFNHFNSENITHFVSNYLVASLIINGETAHQYGLFATMIINTFTFIVGLYSILYYFTKSHLSASVAVIFYHFMSGSSFKGESWFNSIYLLDRSSYHTFSLSIWTLLIAIIAIDEQNNQVNGQMDGQNIDQENNIENGVKTGVGNDQGNDRFLIYFAAVLHSFCSTLSIEAYFSILIYIIIYSIVKDFPKFRIIKFLMISFSLSSLFSLILYSDFTNFSKILTFGFSFEHFWKTFGNFGIIASFFGLFILNGEQILMYLPSVVFILLKNEICMYLLWLPFAASTVSLYVTYLYRLKENIFIQFFGMSFALFSILVICHPNIIQFTRYIIYTKPLFSVHQYRFGLWILENTNENSVFIENYHHEINPIQLMANRKILNLSISSIRNLIENGNRSDFSGDKQATHLILYKEGPKIRPNMNIWRLTYSNVDGSVYRLCA
ncbi:hypothetical protein TRFO_06362 [Tritrichomonas foetus]|uniref:Uncharacterized protein n=1 Tax=Tritrichomonas foetus TaxID=1144522 RepID=A0A1J4K0Z4_9EUKA|nr:hypothetical protein TRFO_06362 [Tritrichomonas foetus]|eukprot:OHT04456.1 hypothetical protein TRFO_06362 [Tritrichomonas foetus]